MQLPIENRREAGHVLAAALQGHTDDGDAIVLALPRGGVPVAYEIASALGLELDLLLVRKLGSPGQRELAMGAIASGGSRVLNRDIVSALRIDEATIEATERTERRELERRERLYRGNRPPPAVKGRTVIVVDDGLATGATMRAAIAALRQMEPGRIVVAVPVAPPDTIGALEQEADEVICLATPSPFGAIAKFYCEFGQVSDDEVRELLTEAWQQRRRPQE